MISAPATAVSNADTGSYTKGCHMAKKKNGRNPRNTMESTDRKLIGNAFDDAIRFARKNSSHPNAPKIYDLVGPILKRRCLQPAARNQKTIRAALWKFGYRHFNSMDQ